MTTQHTADYEKPDHEPRVEAWAHADSKAHTGKTPHSKKNWDRKTRRRHSVSATNFPSASDQTSSESVVSTPSEPESLEHEQPSPEAASAADPSKPAEQTPTKASSTNASPIKDYSQPAEEGLPEQQAEEPSSLKDYSLPAQTSQVDLLPSDAPLAEESLAEEESLTKESSAEEPLEQVLEIAQETSETTLEETVAEEVAREEAVAEETTEETVEEVAEEAAEEVAEETAEEVAEEAVDLEMALEDELEDELTEVAEEPELRSARRQPWKAKRHAQAKQAYREERRDQKSRFTEDPRSFSEQLRMPSQQQQYDQEPQTQSRSQLQPQQSQPQPLPEQPQAQQQTRANRQPQSEPRTQSEQQVKSEQKKQSQKKKQRQRSQHYLKSSSLKQAFRNLLKLNGGAAWRETRYATVTFFVLFSLLALAVADSLPAVDAFNAAIISVVHSVRGMLDTFVITLTTIGDFLPMGALCLVVCLILYLGKKWDSLAFFVVNVVLALVCVQALKFIFAVPRPTEETLVPLPQSFSFPSAHSFCSLIVFGLIGLLIYRALVRRGASDQAAMIPGIVLIIFAILVGISRIYVGVHWSSDVLGGWLLAGTWLSYVGALYTAGARQATSSTR